MASTHFRLKPRPGPREGVCHGFTLVEMAVVTTLLAILATLAIHAMWNDWTGGYCFGPRLVCDATPLLSLGLAPLLERRRRLALAALVASALLGAGLAALGAYFVDAPAAQAVYLGSGDHALEWWRYPPVRLWRSLASW